jgi:hypothetical protein
MLFLPETWSQICCSIKYKKFHFHSEEYYNCCPGHIVDDSLGDDSLTHLSDLKSECSFNRTDILNLLEQIREIALKSQSKRIYFDLDSFMSDADY